MTDISMALAVHAATVPFANVGERALASAKRATLDTVGCILAAAQAPGIGIMVDLAREWGGKAEATVLGNGLAVPAPHAAWINGSAARALEIDDCTDFLPLHPTATVVPTLLALAETRGGVRGRDFLAAVAIGQDLIIRLGMATRTDAIQSGRYNLFKIFGSAAAAARLIGLDSERTRHALGIAYAFACGEGQSALDGGLSLRTHEGNSSQGAVLAVLMAERGFTGAKDFLMGRMGFFTSFEPEPKLEPLIKDLGSHFWGEQLSIKPFAACRCTHAAIDMVLTHRRRTSLDPANVAEVRIVVAPGVQRLVGAQLDASASPDSQAAAQFSLPFTVAAALVHDDMFLEQLTPSGIRDERVRALARRISVIADERMVDAEFVIGRTNVEIDCKDGSKTRLEGFKPLGNPAHPLSMAAVADKVRKCARAAGRPLPAAAVEAGISMIESLEDLSDVAALAKELRG